jgi:hypothetical protein
VSKKTAKAPADDLKDVGSSAASMSWQGTAGSGHLHSTAQHSMIVQNSSATQTSLPFFNAIPNLMAYVPS